MASATRQTVAGAVAEKLPGGCSLAVGGVRTMPAPARREAHGPPLSSTCADGLVGTGRLLRTALWPDRG